MSRRHRVRGLPRGRGHGRAEHVVLLGRLGGRAATGRGGVPAGAAPVGAAGDRPGRVPRDAACVHGHSCVSSLSPPLSPCLPLLLTPPPPTPPPRPPVLGPRSTALSPAFQSSGPGCDATAPSAPLEAWSLRRRDSVSTHLTQRSVPSAAPLPTMPQRQRPSSSRNVGVPIAGYNGETNLTPHNSPSQACPRRREPSPRIERTPRHANSAPRLLACPSARPTRIEAGRGGWRVEWGRRGVGARAGPPPHEVVQGWDERPQAPLEVAHVLQEEGEREKG